MDLNFNHLYYFWTIANEGSIKKACKKLHITQPGMSSQLRQLEEHFGKKLFDRKSRRLILNSNGQIAFDYASNIFNTADEMTKALQQAKSKKLNVIKIGVIPSLAKSHIHEFVLPLLKNKKVQVTINEGKSEDLRLKIERDALDIILSDRQGLSRKKKFFNYQLEPRKIIVAAAPNFKFKSLRFPQMLNEAPFMQYTRHSYLRSEIDYFFQTHDVKPEVIGETDDLGLIRLAAEKGLCFSVVPENSISDSIKEKKLVKKGELGGINSDLWATMRSNCDPKTSYLLEKTIRKFKGLKA